MQNAQRCWQPSWTLTKARERGTRRAGPATAARLASEAAATGSAPGEKPREELGEPRLVRVAHDEVDALQGGNLGRARFRPATRDDHPGARTHAARAADRLAVGQLGPRRDGAGVHDHDVGGLLERDRAEASALQQALELLRVGQVHAASKRGEGHGGRRHSTAPAWAPAGAAACAASLSQLTAGRADVLPFAPAHGRGDAALQQDRLEGEDACESGTAGTAPPASR